MHACAVALVCAGAPVQALAEAAATPAEAQVPIPADAPAPSPADASTPAAAEAPGANILAPDLAQRMRDMALAGASQARPANGRPVRFEIELGQIDPRLKLAPCARIEPFLPPAAAAPGRLRIGLRCLEGSKRWTVYWPLTAKAWTPGWIAIAPLAAGTVVAATQWRPGEVDLAAGSGAQTAVAELEPVLGRTLARALPAGAGLRSADLRLRQWFAAGDTVKVLAGTADFQIATEGQALNPGLEGQRVRVRTVGGRTIVGRATGDRLVQAEL